MNTRKKISTIGKYCLIATPLVLAIFAWNTRYCAIPDAGELLASPLSMVDEGRVISLTAEPYWDHTQFKVIQHGDNTKCLHGALVVPLTMALASGSLDGLDIKRVWAHQNGQWWSGTIDEAQTRDGKRYKSMIAYGCASSLFKPFVSTDIVIKLDRNGRISYLRAAAKKLHDVHAVESAAN